MAEKLTLETAVAHRAFEVAGKPGETVDVFIGKPFQMPAGEWACPYRIVGAGEDICFQIYGIDSVQTLQLVWQVMDAHIAATGLEWMLYGERFAGFVAED